jgi:hypothetical protein
MNNGFTGSVEGPIPFSTRAKEQKSFPAQRRGFTRTPRNRNLPSPPGRDAPPANRLRGKNNHEGNELITILVGAEKEKYTKEGDSDLPKVVTTVQSTLTSISAVREWLLRRRRGRFKALSEVVNHQ